VGVILGLDEAGRGPVLGPLVICGYAVREEDAEGLSALGVADSKVLTPEQRSRLVPALKERAVAVILRVVEPGEIDRVVERGGLNQLEIAEFVSIIREAKPGAVQVDALTSRPGRFGRQLAELVRPLRPRIVSENRADAKFPAVQAASVVAKVARDSAMEALRAVHGELGSGYPHDPLTRAFLGRCDPANYPSFVRRSWKTGARRRAQGGPGPPRLIR
jgi:ribonuclease HII